MMNMVLTLYPPAAERPLTGTYLDEDIRELGTTRKPFVYANFVSSLDGRIAVIEPERAESFTLDEAASSADWRLFQELQAHATCLITHGGYLRALAAGKLDDILQVGVSEQSRDIGAWRAQHGLDRQPAVAIASTSLEFTLPPSLHAHSQPVFILTTAAASSERRKAWEKRGYPVIVTGDGNFVEGAAMVRAVGDLGYERLYLLTGPTMLQSVLRDRVLSRLYLTMTHQIVGGDHFHTLASGPLLGAAGGLKLRTLYFDPNAPKNCGQWFASFVPRGGEPMQA